MPASRAASKARIALCGPSGSGKTYTGLVLCLDPDGPSVRSEVPCPACTAPLHELLEET